MSEQTVLQLEVLNKSKNSISNDKTLSEKLAGGGPKIKSNLSPAILIPMLPPGQQIHTYISNSEKSVSCFLIPMLPAGQQPA